MARGTEADPLGAKVGARVRRLRKERAKSLDRLAADSEIGSKAHLSDIERGLSVPKVATLDALASALGCDLLDLVTFPEESDRQMLVALSRKLSAEDLRAVLADVRRRVRGPTEG